MTPAPAIPRPVLAAATVQATERIKKAIVQEGERLKARYGWLRHQDALGTTIMLLAVAGMAASGWAWYVGLLSAWLSIPLAAVCASVLHELEHDLIHQMYFRKQPVVHNLMLAVCWLTRPLTINPWLRRKLHFHHHKHSGTETDYEERAITNGEHFGAKRLAMMFDPLLATTLRAVALKDPALRKRLLLRSFVAYFPVGIAAWTAWYAFLGLHLAAWLGGTVAWSAGTLQLVHVLDVVTVVLIAPNLLRSFCINFVSSNMHYYGDVEDGNVVQQTQVLNPWWLTPFQLFCFNFGSTHAIHHFVVAQPFYLRQLVAGAAHPVMREMGVRFNDLGSFGRANRWAAAKDAAAVGTPAQA